MSSGVSLRVKLAVLAAVFGLTLVGTMGVAIWCVEVPFAAASEVFRSSTAGLLVVAELRSLVQTERALLVAGGQDAAQLEQLRGEQRHLLARLIGGADEHLNRTSIVNIQQLLLRKDDEIPLGGAAPALDAIDPRAPRPPADLIYLELDHLLAATADKLRLHAEDATRESYRTRREVVTILALNTAVGAMVAVLGMLLVRRWVLAPIADLHAAARHVAAGNLDHRVPVRSADELGRLSEQVNQMAVSLTEMKRTIARQERMAATGEMISYIAHNIRNPLAGIRSLAEASLSPSDAGPAMEETRDRPRMIIESIDRLQQWLRSVEHSVRPLELSPEPTDPTVLVEGVLSVFRPMAERRQVGLEWRPGDRLESVQLDVRHFEQALAAILGNAIEASPAGAAVSIQTGARENGSAGWWMAVADRGPGIPPENRERVFEPFFTTKKTGTGMGLALARRIIELHGGRIYVECPDDGGSVFTIEMPEERVQGFRHGGSFRVQEV